MCKNTSLAALGQSLPACNTAPPAKSKMAARGPQNGQWGLERCLPLGFFYLSTPSMRKGDDTGEETGGKENNDENSGH